MQYSPYFVNATPVRLRQVRTEGEILRPVTCPKCGPALTGLSAACPECGTKVVEGKGTGSNEQYPFGDAGQLGMSFRLAAEHLHGLNLALIAWDRHFYLMTAALYDGSIHSWNIARAYVRFEFLPPACLELCAPFPRGVPENELNEVMNALWQSYNLQQDDLHRKANLLYQAMKG